MQIIVWEDKHTTNYYDASTLEAWDASCIEILKVLTDKDYGYMRRVEPYITEEQERLASIDLEVLPEAARAELEQKVLKARQRIANEKHDAEQENKALDEALAYIEAGKSPTYTSPNGRYTYPMAWRIIQNRSGYEYENFSLEDVFTVNKESK